MKSNKRQCAIIALNHETMQRDIRDLEILELPFHPLLGCYKGSLEDSYLVLFNNDNDLTNIKSLAIDRGQESILIQRTDGSCYLDYFTTKSRNVDGTYSNKLVSQTIMNVPKITEVGQLTPVSGEYARRQDSWSYDRKNKQHWVCI